MASHSLEWVRKRDKESSKDSQKGKTLYNKKLKEIECVAQHCNVNAAISSSRGQARQKKLTLFRYNAEFISENISNGWKFFNQHNWVII